jgi:glyoxylase-like metal-dependent hydrolase (beta-lactamase superfamily II)
MKITPISAGNLHCDGGALFSVIPKVLWSKVYPANENNFIQLTMRCLLIEQGNQKILIEAGVGNHYSDKYLQNNGIIPGNQLEKSLQKNGVDSTEITDVLFTHLHWDHCTGAVKNIDGKLQLTFPNAKLWSSKKQWEHSKISNAREKAAYHRQILDFMFYSGKLNFVKNEGELFQNVDVRFFDGHTPGQIIPYISSNNKTYIYTADLIPTTANVPLLWLAAYDLFPVTALKEKEQFLNEVAEKNYILFFEHDYYTECATLKKSEKGVVIDKKFNYPE